MKDANQALAARAGIIGCPAGERIISIAPDGSVYPCSQLVGQAYYAGNLIRDPFEIIWLKSPVLDKYRNFRQSESFFNGVCGKCGSNRSCGGCRVFANDAVGSEPSCPMEQ